MSQFSYPNIKTSKADQSFLKAPPKPRQQPQLRPQQQPPPPALLRRASNGSVSTSLALSLDLAPIQVSGEQTLSSHQPPRSMYLSPPPNLLLYRADVQPDLDVRRLQHLPRSLRYGAHGSQRPHRCPQPSLSSELLRHHHTYHQCWRLRDRRPPQLWSLQRRHYH